MSGLSEVSKLFAQRAGDLEKAREIFTAESRNYVAGILGAVHRARSEPWTLGRIRIDLPRDVETEGKTGYLSSQYTTARAALCFKKRTKFVNVADVSFGIEFDQTAEAFVWQMVFVPSARYPRLDDVVWQQYRTANLSLPGAQHQQRANSVRLVQRTLGADLAADAPYNDVKAVLEFLLTADAALTDAVGFEPSPDEAPAAG